MERMKPRRLAALVADLLAAVGIAITLLNMLKFLLRRMSGMALKTYS
jgi:hypothetical protein